jgi:hypothetical protein
MSTARQYSVHPCTVLQYSEYSEQSFSKEYWYCTEVRSNSQICVSLYRHGKYVVLVLKLYEMKVNLVYVRTGLLILFSCNFVLIA